ncbi:PLP-dependent aminotransferase family protein [Kitasatospora sp. NPDC058965]|uniref:aminotransferase-like domain-containing protein n=1 Tax=Kitasatospora sp. NPDC058965 TaxID=3346682 RepID=UPI0036ACBC96
MDQDLGWWVRVALDGWRHRRGPRYRRIAATLAEAAARRVVRPGDRLPPERLLADALAVSRGTVVRAYQELAEQQLVERRQGSGTYLRRPPVPPPSTAPQPPAPDVDLIDLSLPVPGSAAHLPAVGALPALDGYGHGVHPAGLPELREALAEHLSSWLRLPTAPEQLIVTAGSGQALALLGAALPTPGRPLLTGCPGRPGLADLLPGHPAVGLPLGPQGQLDLAAVDRAARRAPAPVLLLDGAAHQVPPTRHAELLALPRRHGAVLVEDLSQPTAGRTPLAALDPGAVALGSLSATFWAGLRIGWLRAEPELLERVLALRQDLAPAVPGQLLAVELLRAADPGWHRHQERTRADQRALLEGALAEQLPGWRVHPVPVGLALRVQLPVTDATTFAHLAATRFGVRTTAGAAACLDGRHLAELRLGYARSPGTLRAAVDRLRAAWQEHTRQLAASP